MPNWKKIVTSGSDAALNSLNVTLGVTGSLLGTASYATQALTASYASNLGGFDSAYFVDITSSQTIDGQKTLLQPVLLGQGGATNGKLFFYGVDTGNKISIEATGLGDLNFVDQTGSLLAILYQNGTGFELNTGEFRGNLIGTASFADTASVALSASYAPSTPTFPYTGSAIISGSLVVTGSLDTSGQVTANTVAIQTTTYKAILNSNALTSSNNYYFPNKQGTLALREDLPKSGSGLTQVIATPDIFKLGGNITENTTFTDDTNTYNFNFNGPSIYLYKASDSSAPTIRLNRASGDASTPLPPSSSGYLGSITAGGYDSGVLASSAALIFQASENFSSSSRGTEVAITTTLNGTNTPTRRLTVKNDGIVELYNGLTITGSLDVTGSITGSLLGTASYANQALSASQAISSSNASLATNVVGSANRILFNNGTNTTTTSNNLTWNDSINLLTLGDGTGAAGTISKLALYTSSYGGYGLGVSSAQLDYVSDGSHVFYKNGVTPTELVRITNGGTVLITGSLEVTNGITGSLLGTASYSTQALSASNADTLDGIDSTNFVQTSTNQSITGEKSFRNTTFFGLGSSAGLDGKVTFVDGTNDFKTSLSVDSEGNIIVQDTSDVTLATIYQNGDGISLASGTFTGNLTGTADTASYYSGSVVSSSYASSSTSASYALNSTSASFASTLASGLNLTASNLLVTDTITANNIIANSASFGYVETISGSAVIIGQEYIVLNTQAPASRFAGLQIYDSGSNATSSIVWDSLNNKFIYSNASGSTYNGGGFMAGPRNTGSLGDETFPTLNKVLRGQGGDHMYDSNITDDNTNVSISIPVTITGSFTVITGSNVELQVLNTGVRLGNIITDAHTVTGSLGITGSLSITGSGTNTLLLIGSGSSISSSVIQTRNGAGTTSFTVRNDGKVVVGSNSATTATGKLTIFQGSTSAADGLNFQTTTNDGNQFGLGAVATTTVQIGFNASGWNFTGTSLRNTLASNTTYGSFTMAPNAAAAAGGINVQGSFSDLGLTGGFGVLALAGGNSYNDSLSMTLTTAGNGNAPGQSATLYCGRTYLISGSRNNISSIVLNSTFNQIQAISTGSITGINHIPVITSAYNYRAFDFSNTTAYTPNAAMTNYVWSRISSNISASVNSQQITGLDIVLSGSNSAFTGVTRSALRLSTQNITDNALTAIGRVTIVGSGSAQPIFTVQGSQGELFSVTDSLTGSLFSVNDISGLPIMEVFSDNTILMGDYQDPMMLTTKKIVQTNSGSFVVYSIPTSSYDGAFIDYTIKSGSNARAGTIMSTWANSSIEFTEVDTMDIGSTTAVGLTMILSGSNAVLTGSSSTGAWTIRTIIRTI
jgi:hypothetical protein